MNTSDNRNAKIKLLFESGKTLQEIGVMFGNISRERVRQILRSMKVDPSSGGQKLNIALRRQNLAALQKTKRNLRFLSIYGTDQDKMAQLIEDKELRRQYRTTYLQLKKNCHARKLVFDLSFEDWFLIWKESGQSPLHDVYNCESYVMARRNPDGGYTKSNVWIRTNRLAPSDYQKWLKNQ